MSHIELQGSEMVPKNYRHRMTYDHSRLHMYNVYYLVCTTIILYYPYNIMTCSYLYIITDQQELFDKLKQWAKEAGEDCTISFHAKNVKSPVVSTDDSDPWWRAFSSACAKQ